MKTCSVCKALLSFGSFSKNKRSKDGFKTACKKCITERERDSQKEYRDKNKDKYFTYNKNWYKNNKDIKQEYDKQYYQLNKSKISTRKNINDKNRYKIDPCFKLRSLISHAINYGLKLKQSDKNNVSCLKSLFYTIQELKDHLEKQFEPWMTWNNHGQYDIKTWKNDDRSTWKWNIDHIIPQSDLLYSSMEDDNFKKCWALNNLRPLSAKQNILDGVNKTRHIKI